MSFVEWKTGKRTGRVVYQGNVVVAVFESPKLAADAVRAINAHVSLADSAEEMRNIIERLYKGEPVNGELLDALDSSRAALKKAGRNVP